MNLEMGLKNKVKILNDREYYINEKGEKNDTMHQELLNFSERVEREKRDIMLNAKSLEAKMKKCDDNNRILENERENLIKKHNELETEKMIINSEKIKIEQQLADIRLRTQNLDVTLLFLMLDAKDKVCY